VENRRVMNPGGDLSGQQDLVAFRLSGQAYALPIEPVKRIIEMVTITPIPQVSGVVEGIINVHGVAVPVINLRRHFGLPETPWGARTPIILVQISEQTFGLVVDEVIDVLNLSVNQISRVADILPEVMSEEPIIRGVAHVQGDTVLLLDVEYLLSSTHMQILLQTVEALPEPVVLEALQNAEVTLEDTSNETSAEVLDEETSQDRGGGRATMLVNGFEQGIES
jgi:purine-binding chemotaxis protein CheW